MREPRARHWLRAAAGLASQALWKQNVLYVALIICAGGAAAPSIPDVPGVSGY